MSDQIIIYTDGAARGNPGPGGYGIVLISGPYRKEMSQGYYHTTNNRMELLAVIIALETIKNKPSDIIVYSDSRYVIDSIQKGWIFGWEKKKFQGKKNSDLWIRFLTIYRQHKIIFEWIKGHDINKENIKCDKLAVGASLSNNMLVDYGYDNNSADTDLLKFNS